MDDALPATPPPTPAPTPAAPPTAAVAAAPLPAARRRPAPPAKPQGNVKETIEQILVAFILAFVFRCFVVEAFVIPTGSMAPTLLGAHMDFRCIDCGWHWTVNYSGDSDGDDVNVPARAAEVVPARCPNCGYKVPRLVAGEPDNGATMPPVRFGDRILVQKYVYLLHPPERWDVVVFKTPEMPNPGSGVEPYTQNYIKRLVGRPGETIMLLDGDVYVAPSAKPLATLTPEDFVVQTKPRRVQDALWRIVYAADYRPRGQSRTYTVARQRSDPTAPGGVRTEERIERADSEWRDPWLVGNGNGWRLDGRNYRLDTVDAAPATLRFDTSVASDRHPLTDWLAYDVTYAVPRRSDSFLEPGYDVMNRNDPLNNVSDVKLTATYQRTSGEGAIRFNLSKYGRRFTAELTSTRVRLLTKGNEDAAAVELSSAAWSPGRSLHAIEFENVDYRVALRIDGRDVLTTTPEQYKPDVAGLLADFKERRKPEPASVWIDAEGQSCTLRHLSLWRDIYYLNRDWSRGPYKWGMPDEFPTGTSYGRLIQLGDDEYFTLGDNSMLSADARVWTSPVVLPQERLNVADGRVPGRFLLGRAFFVYWPAGFAPLGSLPAFVPNFGEMRFIH